VLFIPCPPGANFTLIVQEPPGLTVPQGFDWLNDVTLPLSVSIVMDVILRSAWPTLETVTGLTDVLPLFIVPKAREEAGATERVPVAPAWLTVTVLVPMVIVPVRAAPVFVETKKVIVPLPFPAPEIKVIQGALVDALHAQVLAAWTVNWSCRPAYPTLKPPVVVETEQTGAVPA